MRISLRWISALNHARPALDSEQPARRRLLSTALVLAAFDGRVDF